MKTSIYISKKMYYIQTYIDSNENERIVYTKTLSFTVLLQRNQALNHSIYIKFKLQAKLYDKV